MPRAILKFMPLWCSLFHCYYRKALIQQFVFAYREWISETKFVVTRTGIFAWKVSACNNNLHYDNRPSHEHCLTGISGLSCTLVLLSAIMNDRDVIHVYIYIYNVGIIYYPCMSPHISQMSFAGVTYRALAWHISHICHSSGGLIVFFLTKIVQNGLKRVEMQHKLSLEWHTLDICHSGDFPHFATRVNIHGLFSAPRIGLCGQPKTPKAKTQHCGVLCFSDGNNWYCIISVIHTYMIFSQHYYIQTATIIHHPWYAN